MKKNLAIFSALMMFMMVGGVLAIEPCTINADCDDGIVCNGFETCDLGLGVCESGTPLDCNDGNACTDDSCDSVNGCVFTDNTGPCDDGDMCTINDLCSGGTCSSGSPAICDDSDVCTTDSCDSSTGCIFTPNPECTDTEGPIIIPGDIPIWPSCEIYPTISAEIIDDLNGIKFGSVRLNYKYDGFGWDQVSFMNPPINDVYGLEVNWFTPTDNEPFSYYIEASDNLDNIAYEGSEQDPFGFVYDCEDPTSIVLNAPGNWVIEATATVDCDDDASGCDGTSYKLKVYSSNPGNCPQDYSEYDLGSSELITNYSWVCAAVKDNAGNDGFSSPVEFLVDGVDPTADANGPYECLEGYSVFLDATASTDDIIAGLLAYAWDLDDDGFYDDSTDSNPEYDCINGDSVETVSVEITDHVGNTDIADSTVTISNVAPEVEAGVDQIVNEGELVTINPIITDAGIEDTHTAEVNWGDGTTNSLTSHTYADNGVYTVAVTVTDDEGGVSLPDTLTITVNNVAPEVEAGIDQIVNEGDLVTINPTFTDVGILDTHTAIISWGDGTADTNVDPATSPMSESHTYADDGTYTVTVTVDDGEDNGFDTLTITVNNVAPEVEAGVDQIVNEGDLVTINPTFTDVGILDTHTAIISWGDGTADTNVDPATSPMSESHTYADNGVYTVTVTVTDDDNGEGSDTLTITVYDYGIELNEGWNLMSIPLVPEDDDTSIGSVLSEILGDVNNVWSYQEGEWKFYKDGISNELDEIIPGYGYYVLMNDSATVYQNGKKMYGNAEEGNAIPKPPVVNLKTNSWNLIGVYGNNNPLIKDALETLTDQSENEYYDIIYDQYMHNPDLNLESTKGYWLSIKLIPGSDSIQYKASYSNPQ